jgi:3-oxoacyl-(acyl-carrier-protein) synthase
MDIFITGMGSISAIGKNTQETLSSLKKNRTGVAEVELLKTDHKVKVGEIKMTDQSMASQIGLKGNIPTRTTLLGIIAAKEAIENAEIQPSDSKYRTGFISASTVGGMVKSELHFQNFLAGNSYETFVDTEDMGDSTEFIADYFGIKEFISTINTACSSSLNAIILGARLLKSGRLDRVIVGGTDSLSKFTINGFNSLMLLDTEICRPFDANRKGINLGEGAAFLVLETEKTIKNNRKPIAKLAGYGCSNDAFHATASSPDGRGLYLSMSEALEMAKLKPEEIDYLNAHGTATPNNDLTEGMAIKNVFGDKIKFSSTKPFTGHTLAPSGSLESVFSLLAMQNNFIPANLNFENPITEHGLIPVLDGSAYTPIKNIITNAAGMGGACTSLIFSDN